jgi:hypothetical protein
MMYQANLSGNIDGTPEEIKTKEAAIVAKLKETNGLTGWTFSGSDGATVALK